MLENYVSRLNPRKPMLDSTRAVSETVVHSAIRIKCLVVQFLKAISKCWAFFKDLHFSFYVIIPVISSFTSLGLFESLVLWGLFFLPLLIVITFTALDSIFDLRALDSGSPPLRSVSVTDQRPPSILPLWAVATRRETRSSGFAHLQSPIHSMPARRHRPLRPLRGRRPGYW